MIVWNYFLKIFYGYPTDAFRFGVRQNYCVAVRRCNVVFSIVSSLNITWKRGIFYDAYVQRRQKIGGNNKATDSNVLKIVDFPSFCKKVSHDLLFTRECYVSRRN